MATGISPAPMNTTKAGLNRGWFNQRRRPHGAQPEPAQPDLRHQLAAHRRLFPSGLGFGFARSARDQCFRPLRHPADWHQHGGHGGASAVARKGRGRSRGAPSVEMRAPGDEVLATNHTRAGTADLNDMPDFTLPDHLASVTFRFVRDGEAREKTVSCMACTKTSTLDLAWDELTPVSPALLAAEAWLARPAAERGPAPELAISRDDAAAPGQAGMERAEANPCHFGQGRTGGQEDRAGRKFPEVDGTHVRRCAGWHAQPVDYAAWWRPGHRGRERRQLARLLWPLRISARQYQRGAPRSRQHLGHVACAVGGSTVRPDDLPTL